MTTLEFRRWKRYGHDRLYIADALGTKLGHLDLATGEYVFTESVERTQVEQAVAKWCAAEGVLIPSRSAVPERPAATKAPPPPTPPVDEASDWVDLAAHRPGEGVRILAEQEWAAARERSKVFSFANRYLFDSKTDERAWRKGAEGEEYVGGRLNKLREKGWHVLHSVPVGKGDSDIDHIVIGPGGVFTVNSKKHDGKRSGSRNTKCGLAVTRSPTCVTPSMKPRGPRNYSTLSWTLRCR